MSLTGPRVDPYAAGGRHRWSIRRVSGWILVGIAIVYALLLIDAAVGFAWWIRDDYNSTGNFEFDAFEPLRLLTLPGSYFVPRVVVDGDHIMTMGIYLGLVAFAQAGLIACLGWALVVRRWPQRIAPGVVALVLVGLLAVVNAVAYEPTLQLPDRSSPAVVAEEARLATLVAAQPGFDGEPATCKVRLLASEGDTSYVNTRCTHRGTESVVPARVTGSTVVVPTDERADALAAIFPAEVRRALTDQQAAVQP